MTTAVEPQLESNQAGDPRSDTAGVIAPPSLIYLGVLGIGFGLDAVMEPVSLPSSVAVPVGAASLIAGAGLLGSFLRAFRRARTPVDPYARYLERKFATAYGDYKRRVRRWM